MNGNFYRPVIILSAPSESVHRFQKSLMEIFSLKFPQHNLSGIRQ